MNTLTTTQRVNNYLVGLARKRHSGTVTADDAHRVLDRLGVPDIPNGRLAYINSVLNRYNTQFISSGTTLSTRPSANRRRITTWEYTPV